MQGRKVLLKDSNLSSGGFSLIGLFGSKFVDPTYHLGQHCCQLLGIALRCSRLLFHIAVVAVVIDLRYHVRSSFGRRDGLAHASVVSRLCLATRLPWARGPCSCGVTVGSVGFVVSITCGSTSSRRPISCRQRCSSPGQRCQGLALHSTGLDCRYLVGFDS